MTTSSNNPLGKYFRQPQLYIKLPSRGRWWPTDSLDIPANQEFPVFAMTARDEILLKTPDAVMNGQGTVDVVQSCIPNIKNAWDMPLVDLDTILISIRQATYGNAMDTVSVCPHCKKKNDHGIDLGFLINRFSTCPDFESTIQINDLEIYIKPQNFKDFNQNSMETYEQQRLLEVVRNESLSEEEKMLQFGIHFKKLVTIAVNQLAKSVAAIKIGSGEVVDNPEHIQEFLSNCDRTTWDTIKKKLEDLSTQQQELKMFGVVCEHEDCAKPYNTPIEFETSHFFA